MSSAPDFVNMNEDEFAKEAIRIVETSQSKGVCQRIMGSLAVYIHNLDSPEIISTFMSLGRFGEGKPNFTDLDLAAYSKQSKQLTQLFKDMGFKPDQFVNSFFSDKRLIYYSPGSRYHVDVFLNRLDFSHVVEFGDKPGSGRLELDSPTITLTDIVLEKLQIHEINRKDLIDLVVLFLGHDVSQDGVRTKELVDGAYISGILCDDWGFYYDAITNLSKVGSLTKELANAGKLTDGQSSKILEMSKKITHIVESGPKTKKWESRAKVGTKKSWYREVEEVVR